MPHTGPNEFWGGMGLLVPVDCYLTRVAHVWTETTRLVGAAGTSQYVQTYTGRPASIMSTPQGATGDALYTLRHNWLISNVASGSTWHTCEDISPAVELDACDEVLVAFLTHGTPPDGQNAGSTTWFFDSR